MKSFLSRLASSLLRRPNARPAVPTPPAQAADVGGDDGADIGVSPVESIAVVTEEPVTAPPPAAPREMPVETAAPKAAPTGLRLGVDFGTSTIQVAAYTDGQLPQLLRLESLTDHMPSYFALEEDGTPRFGSAAMNLPDQIHSVKPRLVDDVETDGFGHPSKVAFAMLEEVVRRTIERLAAQGLLPPTVERLEVATNLGCTPRFELDTRIRLRDIAQRAGLGVTLAELVEEPVAAAYEVMLSAVVSDGRVLIVDMGGGTLDIAVVQISSGGRRFDLYASGGVECAGDKFTEIIATRVREEVRGRTEGVLLTRADETLIWSRSEAAKQALTVRRLALVGLGGISGLADASVEITREWFEVEAGKLMKLVQYYVTGFYRQARLVLDRGGVGDPSPGTMVFEEPERGRIRKLSDVPFDVDAPAHIDRVVLVGGGTNMPMVTTWLQSVFGPDRVIEPEVVGLDRSSLVALGLARPKPRDTANLRFPSWGVGAVFTDADARTEAAIPLFEPYAPSFKVRYGDTASYRYEVAVPTGSTAVALAFQPVGGGDGTRWPAVALPDACDRLLFEMDLFGKIGLSSNGVALEPLPSRAPWSPNEGDLPPWLPTWKVDRWWEDMPDWDMRNDK